LLPLDNPREEIFGISADSLGDLNKLGDIDPPLAALGFRDSQT
jgi:hypothetical protein